LFELYDKEKVEPSAPCELEEAFRYTISYLDKFYREGATSGKGRRKQQGFLEDHQCPVREHWSYSSEYCLEDHALFEIQHQAHCYLFFFPGILSCGLPYICG
jgi:hypothetical protein